MLASANQNRFRSSATEGQAVVTKAIHMHNLLNDGPVNDL